MMPITEINKGDLFQNPLTKINIYVVIDKNEKERMIKLQAFAEKDMKEIGKPFWKKNTDRMFSEGWRIFTWKHK